MEFVNDPFKKFGGSLVELSQPVENPFQKFGGEPVQPTSGIDSTPIKNFYNQYLSSPIYQKRLSNFKNVDTPNISNLMNTPIAYGNNPSITTFGISTDKNGKHIYPGTSKINIDTNKGHISAVNKYYGVNNTIQNDIAHELSHGSRVLNPQEEKFIYSLNQNKIDNQIYKDYKKSKSKGSISDFIIGNYENNVVAHDAKPDEIKADLDSLRYQMFKKGIYDTSKRDMTIDDYKKMSQDKDISKSLEFKRLMERFKPSDLIKLNNTIAYGKRIRQSMDNVA